MKNYLRFLSRNKLYTAIMAVGLSVSLAFVVITTCHAWNMYSITHDVPDHENIYVVSGLTEFESLPGLKEYFGEIPEIRKAASYNHGVHAFFKTKNETSEGPYACVDRGFREMFPIRLLAGNWNAFDKSDGVMVTKSFAERHFGNAADAVGKNVEIIIDKHDNHSHSISGVVEDFTYTIFRDPVILLSERPAYIKAHMSSQLFIGCDEDINQKDISAKVRELIRRYFPGVEDQLVKYGMDHDSAMALDTIYFHHQKNGLKHGDVRSLVTMTIIGIVLLLASVLNYINLSFAQTFRRSRKIATMRLVGASKSLILRQYLFESLIMTIICIILGILLAVALLPVINSISSTDAHIGIPFTAGTISVIIVITLIVSILSGVGPAILAVSFNPIEVTKGSFRKQRKMSLTKTFICIQCTLAVIVTTLAVAMEISTSKRINTPTGADVDDIMFIERVLYHSENDPEVIKKLEECPYVISSAGYCKAPFGCPSGAYATGNDGRKIYTGVLSCDSTAFNLMGFEVRDIFSKELIGSLWLSEGMVQATGMTYEDVHKLKPESIFSFETEYHLKGLEITHLGGTVGNFMKILPGYIKSAPAECVVMVTEKQDHWDFIAVRTTNEHKDAKEAIKKILENYYEEKTGYNPEFELMYIDDYVSMSMMDQIIARNFIRLFMIIAIFISCLGLIGMSSYYAVENTKSISVHKVFGGTDTSEVLRNMRIYIRIIAIANFIGLPVSYYISRRLLSDFLTESDNMAVPLIISAIITLLISLFAVFWQTLRAARTNPVEALKKE